VGGQRKAGSRRTTPSVIAYGNATSP